MSHEEVLFLSIALTVIIILLDYFFSYLNTNKREQDVKNQLKEDNEYLD